MMAWMVYAAAVGVMLAIGGLALERLAAAAGQPRRIAWLAALTLAVLIPLAGGWRKPATAPAVEAVATEPPATGGVVVGELWSAIPTLTATRGMATGRIAAMAWGAGSLATLAVLAWVLALVARGRRRWERRTMHGTEVYLSRGFGPALVGIARPEVVLPAWVVRLEPGAREAIIRHELEHARARDHLVLLSGGLAVAAFPWSPAIWWMYRRLRAAVELDCDQRVLASGIGVADYGDVLLNAGCRSRGRWGFAPAMGQPESLLERRLKTMSEKRRKPNAGYTALLAAAAVGAVVVACDTPVPTEVREAFEEVTADQGVQGTEAEMERRSVRLRLLRDFVVTGRSRDAGPAVYLDGVRVPGPTETSDGEDPLSRLDPHEILRIEVLKGSAARELYGDEAASGVILVFTKEAEPVPELVAVPSVGEFVVEAVTGPEGAESEVELHVEELVVTGRARAEPVAGLKVEELVVTGQARAQSAAGLKAAELVRELTATELALTRLARAQSTREPKATEPIRELTAAELVVTGQGTVWTKWLTENPGSTPVIYVDDVRVDAGGPGLDRLSSALAAHRIDRVEVIKGEKARELYGDEGERGVILIFTKK